MATLSIVAMTLILPFTVLGDLFGFSRLPVSFLLTVGLITICYIITAEITKKIFYRNVTF